MSSKKEQICTLLKGIEKSDPGSVTVVNESQYIQRNPLTRAGNVGLAELFKRLSKRAVSRLLPFGGFSIRFQIE
ncbi:MAG: hypothetical protein HN763_13260 [Opitutales bacterium]|jgi:hypothetical protein|nr:hypothetical protein [Opitutales bacterium]